LLSLQSARNTSFERLTCAGHEPFRLISLLFYLGPI
jgi:hypothetical protein